MDLKLNVSKKGLSTTEEVINEEYTLHYGHIFRGKSAYEYAVDGGFVGSEEEYEAYVGSIGNLSEEAKEATAEAKEAAVDAHQAAQDVTTAKEETERATERANEAATNANDAWERAITAAEQAEDATMSAKDALGEVNASLEEFDSQRHNYVQNDTFTETFDRVVAAIDWIENNKVDKVEGKGLSTNDFTDEHKKKVEEFAIDKELSATSDNAIANSGVVQGLAGLAEGVSEAIGNVSEQLGKAIGTKANKEGYYPDMSVGMADNLVGRGDVQDAQINFRPSAGADNITDGAARIERIKGNSVVYNQLAQPQSKISSGVTCTHIGDGIVELSGIQTSANVINAFGVLNGIATHKMMSCIEVLSMGNHNTLSVGNANVYSGRSAFTSEGRIVIFYTLSSSGANYLGVLGTEGLDYTGVKVRMNLIDLTKMFGAGNEPTTYEEYLQRKPMNIEDEYAYNEGELIDMKVDSLVSVGDNAWDEEWENGTFNTTTGTNINNAYSDKQIRSKNLIKVLPNTKYTCTIPAKIGQDAIWCMLLDKNKEVITGYTVPYAQVSGNSFGLLNYAPSFTTPANAAYLKFYCAPIYGDVYTNDICIHLEQSGYKNGKYYPYQQDVKDLSFISEVFPNGMRSAGSAFDEIRFNPTKKVWEAVKRVESRVFAEGDAEDTTVKTDGAITNYPLAEPIVVEIEGSENWNLDYLVWDFGTEEAIVPNNAPSAPFRADINYEPNAVDDLRWAVAEIRKLKAQIAQMSASVTNLTE